VLEAGPRPSGSEVFIPMTFVSGPMAFPRLSGCATDIRPPLKPDLTSADSIFLRPHGAMSRVPFLLG